MQTVIQTTQLRRYKKSFSDIVDFVDSRKAPKSNVGGGIEQVAGLRIKGERIAE